MNIVLTGRIVWCVWLRSNIETIFCNQEKLVSGKCRWNLRLYRGKYVKQSGSWFWSFVGISRPIPKNLIERKIPRLKRIWFGCCLGVWKFESVRTRCGEFVKIGNECKLNSGMFLDKLKMGVNLWNGKYLNFRRAICKREMCGKPQN